MLSRYVSIPVEDYIPLDIINNVGAQYEFGTRVLDYGDRMYGAIIPFSLNVDLITDIDYELTMSFAETEATMTSTGEEAQRDSAVWRSNSLVAANGTTIDGLYNGFLNISLENPVPVGEYVNVQFSMSMKSHAVYPVPKPAVMLILGSSLIGLVGFGRKSKRS